MCVCVCGEGGGGDDGFPEGLCIPRTEHFVNTHTHTHTHRNGVTWNHSLGTTNLLGELQYVPSFKYI